MSIHESIHHYNVGTLITVGTDKLKVAQMILHAKIGFMQEVAKQQNVAAEVWDDMRKYNTVHDEIAKLLEARANPSTPLRVTQFPAQAGK